VIFSSFSISSATTSKRVEPSGRARSTTFFYGCQLAALLMFIGGCSPRPVEDPVAVLSNPNEITGRHYAAMRMLEASGDQAATSQALKRVIVADGYFIDVREMAYRRMESIDREGLQRLLEIQMPKIDALQWRARLCELIAEEPWIDMTPTLIRAWARPMPNWVDTPAERPERLALVEMYGEEKLPDVLVQVMLDADPIVSANLRARCWELLIAEGQRDRVIELLADSEISPTDGMFRDLRTIADRTGIIPRNREEIIWARTLCQPENVDFLDAAAAASLLLPEARHEQLELRDLGILVAAVRIDPGLLEQDEASLYAGLRRDADVDGRRLYAANFTGWNQSHTERLRDVREKLSWNDLLAMRIAIESLSIDALRDHVFDYAERDLLDDDTEFGGVIAVDSQGRIELLEFPPRLRRGDNRFEATQELFDAAYTGVFHFHNHAQEYDNADYAGPHMGDFAYAESTRANCLVFTFIDSRTINADYYRHGGIVVDLGTFRRPD
jgi:hypothetical protein